MYKIFLVEDDEDLQNHIKDYIEKYDYTVSMVNDFKKLEEQFEKEKPDLVLLDINLPYYDGFYFCRIFRRKSSVPIIIISARTDEMEQIMGIEFGADDYITKPFSLQMLLTKIKACMRRSYDLSSTKTDNLSTCELYLNDSNFKITYKGIEIELSKNEFILLKRLVEKKDEIVTREELLEILWDDTQFVDDNTLTVNVTRVKNRLKEIGIKNAIRTKRGAGYVLDIKELT